MTRRIYLIASFATLAAFSVALVWPEFVLDFVSRFDLESDIPRRTYLIRPVADTSPATPSAETVDVSGIDFEVTQEDVEAASAESAAPEPSPSSNTSVPLSDVNRLIVPRMGVDADVIHGETEKTLLKGLWHIPGSAYPGENGNIVISAHRWLYKPPNPKTFYLIDKMQVGDPIYYEYRGSRYEYRVTKTFVVDPDQVEILSQDENKLTLFTCTPLYSTKQRLVVNAELVSVTPL